VPGGLLVFPNDFDVRRGTQFYFTRGPRVTGVHARTPKCAAACTPVGTTRFAVSGPNIIQSDNIEIFTNAYRQNVFLSRVCAAGHWYRLLHDRIVAWYTAAIGRRPF